MKMMPAILCVALALPAVAAAAYPEKPITMIIAFAPGGGTDVAARAMVPYFEKHLGGGAKIVVVNRAGAGGEIGYSALAAAPPDGYTIGFINSPSVLTAPIEKQGPSALQRFDVLGNVVDDPASFAVHADSRLKNLADLVAFAGANPGAVSVGTSGHGSSGHMAMLFFQKATGVRLNHIPFKGAGDTRTGLAGRQIEVAAMSIGEVMQAAKGGTPLRVLGQFSAGRSSLAPEVATAREQGFDVELSSLRGLAAPRGIPADVRERLVRAVAQVAADPEFQQKSNFQYFAPLRYLPPAQFEAALREGDAQFRQLWKESPWAER